MEEQPKVGPTGLGLESARPELPVASGVLASHEGYYHPEGSRNAIFASLEWLTGGTSLRATECGG